jgi:XTP/dITP diphosphohydrolase
MKLIFATTNINKIKEVRLLLPKGFEIISLSDIGCTDELPETQLTIEGNSMQKAQYVADKYACDCFAEDSGLEVEALGGEPGVDTAFYSGTRDADQNMDLLLHNLKGIANRTARFKTVFTLFADGTAHQFTGTVTGNIAQSKTGNLGFGYDPIFIPSGSIKTFGEMQTDEKTRFSHRAKAFSLMEQFLVANFEISK